MRRSLPALLVLALLPAVAQAQLSDLRKKVQEKTGMSHPAGKKGPVQWKEGERVAPFTAKELDSFMASWKAELEYRSLSRSEQDRRDAEHSRKLEEFREKRQKRDECAKTAISVPEAMEMSQQMQARMMKLAQSGDPNPGQKASEEMQKAMMAKLDKKCGPELKDEPESQNTTANFRMKEWITAYLAVRQEKDPQTAGRMVLASPDEMKMLESHLVGLQQLAASEEKVH